MRSALLAAAALAPLALAAAPAAAQTTVSAASSTPLATSTAGDVTIASGGVLTLGGTGAAVTVDSNNSVNNAGSITANNVSGATGILLQGGRTAPNGIVNTGSITLSEDFTASDSANADGIAEAPFAQGTNRYGIHLLQGGPAFVGDVNSSGSITVKGNGSYGVLLESPLQGNLIVGGPVTLTGDGGGGVRENAGVTGAVSIGGSISVTGAHSPNTQDSNAVALNGDVGGRVGIYSALTSTGYATVTRPATATGLANVEKTPADVQQGGSALVLGANVAGGVFLGALGTATTDTDGDGNPDNLEGTAAVTTYGSAPAVVVGAAGRSVTLSNYDTGANAFGLIVRGSISAQGVFDGVTATGLQVGVTGGGPVSLSGGLRNAGAITAGTYDADANAVHILAGATLGGIANEGSLAGSIVASTDAVTSRGLLIDPGAQVSFLANSGTINGTAIGDKASVAALVDRSGTLTSISNTGVISTNLTGTANGTVVDATTGTRTAIDVSANTTGVTLSQSINMSGATPSIVGDILLGSGPNTVDFEGGTVTGALSLGGAASSLTVGGTGIYTGAVSYTGSQLAVTVGAGGTLSLTNPTTLNLSQLTVGPTGVVRFAVDAAAGTATLLNVSGAANIASGAKIGLNVLTTSSTAETLTLVKSGQLTVGAIDTSQLAALPYLVSANLVANPTPGTLQVTIVRRTAAQLGLNSSEASALNGVANGVNSQPALASALLGQTTQAGFASTFRQLLPDRGEGLMRFTEQATRQVGEATGEADDFADAGHVWVQQLVLGYRDNGGADREQSQAGGYGAAGGFQTDQGPFGAVGVTGMFAIGTTADKDRPVSVNVNVTDLEGGVYWRARLGGLRLEARGGGGYLWLHGDRGVAIAATTDASGAQTSAAFNSNSKSDRNGYELSGRVGGSYQLDLGRFFVRPQAHLDYFHLNEDGYTESGGGSGVDLSVASRTGSMTSGVGSVELGTHFGSPDALTWKPSVEVGVRDVFDGDTGALTAGFGGSTTGAGAFTLSPLSLKGTNTLAKVKLSAATRNFDFDVEASGEERSAYKEGAVRAVARFTF